MRFMAPKIEYGKTAFPVAVNYLFSLEEMIEQASFSHLDSNINSENFSIDRGNILNDRMQARFVNLIRFKKKVSAHQALTKIENLGYRPAKIEELIALSLFSEEFNTKGEITIIALGSVWESENGDKVPGFYCSEINSERNLHLSWIEGGWFPHHWFACVFNPVSILIPVKKNRDYFYICV